MRIYIICPVRKATDDEVKLLREYMSTLEEQGHEVFLPNDHAPQEDPVGEKIVKMELEEIKKADEVHIFWHVESYGSHFDLGAALALGKPIKMIHEFVKDGEAKSYSKVIKLYEKRSEKL